MMAVVMPMTISRTCQAITPSNRPEKRSNRYTPALTTAAACRKAETGVSAAIASGSQKWKGICAAFENAARAMRTATMARRTS